MINKKKPEEYIRKILKDEYHDEWEKIFNDSALLQYLNLKSGAIHGNSKSRRSLANWYAIYAILNFYVNDGFVNNRKKYSDFDGFSYSELFNFQRMQYGGAKLQNHALNSRVNGEMADKITNDHSKYIIVRNGRKYLIHPDFIYVDGKDIAPVVLKIIKKYQKILYDKDHEFEVKLEELTTEKDLTKQRIQLKQLLTEDSEARIFEIISYCILETHYKGEHIFIGYTKESIKEEALKLYKTGRTNANDGGIDFVMRPLGRFFQVTEVGNYDKYFLDIDKINRYPLTFVVKTDKTAAEVKKELMDYGTEKSGGMKVLESKYHKAVEDVITINELKQWMDNMSEEEIKSTISEIDHYYKFEMNML